MLRERDIESVCVRRERERMRESVCLYAREEEYFSLDEKIELKQEK